MATLESLKDIEPDEYQARLDKYGISCACGGDFTRRCHEASEGLPCIVNAVRWPDAYHGFEKPTTGANPAWEAMQVNEPSIAVSQSQSRDLKLDHGDAQVVVHDLHVDGDDDCGHDFTDWDISSGAEANPEDGETAVIGFIRMESRCNWCPARVGRLSLAHLNPDGVRL